MLLDPRTAAPLVPHVANTTRVRFQIEPAGGKWWEQEHQQDALRRFERLFALGLLPLDPGEGTEFGAGLAPGGTTAIATATVSSSGGYYELWGCGLTYAAVKMLRYSLMLWLPLLLADRGLAVALAAATAACSVVGA